MGRYSTVRWGFMNNEARGMDTLVSHCESLGKSAKRAHKEMLALVHAPQGPDLLGPRQPCIICREPKCFRYQPSCDRCSSFCWMCHSTKADENCGRCQRATKKLLASTPTSSTNKHLRLSAIVKGTAGITSGEAGKLLSHSDLSERIIRDAAGRGAAGTAAVKRAAVAFASSVHQKSEAGEDIERYCVRPPKPQSKKRHGTKMPTPAAHEAVAQVGEKRLVEPFNRDAPMVALAIVSELFLAASNGVTDPLVVADLNRAKDYVQADIVSKARNPHTHRHGWRTSRIEALERFARREAEKAIKRVLARSPAAVAARQAKERPKKKRARARQRASDAKIKTAKAKGTYKSRTSGDTKIHWKRAATHRDRKRRLKSAYTIKSKNTGRVPAHRTTLKNTRSIKRFSRKPSRRITPRGRRGKKRL